MLGRTYESQTCSVARTLELVGERWTLLIIRDAFLGVRRFGDFATLVEARPITGRTHQIRVHAKHAGHSIAGDAKYGDDEFSREIRELGGKRLFLHSAQLRVPMPDGSTLELEAEVDDIWRSTLERLDA